jgi:hypothetical protein
MMSSGSDLQPALKTALVFSFHQRNTGVEELAFRYDDEVVATGEAVSTEDLSNQTFGPIPQDSSADFAGGSNAQAAGDGSLVA